MGREKERITKRYWDFFGRDFNLGVEKLCKKEEDRDRKEGRDFNSGVEKLCKKKR